LRGIAEEVLWHPGMAMFLGLAAWVVGKVLDQAQPYWGGLLIYALRCLLQARLVQRRSALCEAVTWPEFQRGPAVSVLSMFGNDQLAEQGGIAEGGTKATVEVRLFHRRGQQATLEVRGTFSVSSERERRYLPGFWNLGADPKPLNSLTIKAGDPELDARAVIYIEPRLCGQELCLVVRNKTSGRETIISCPGRGEV
jgi:hypothetical protein